MYLLRCLQAGLKFPDLEHLEVGLVLDLLTESGNDSYNYKQLATQEDMDRL